jgi:crotonobetainyl-CoA:carnitine CoA-transferase CaiB-like acyl-CoA transferase
VRRARRTRRTLHAAPSWGYGYDDIQQWNPGLIYASNSGYGPSGQWAPLGSYDLGTQAYCGAMATQGGGPSHAPVAVEWAMADEV